MDNLEQKTREEKTLFFKSFDYILWNIEDVLWGSKQGTSDYLKIINAFNASKKTNIFLANNLCSPDALCNQLQHAGCDIEKLQILQPIQCIISYLMSINFTKEVLVIGMSPIKSTLKQAGFKVYQSDSWKANASTTDYVKHCLKYSDKVGAVIADCDLNMKRPTLQNAITHLLNPDTMLIAGGSELFFRHNNQRQIIAPGFFHKVLENFTGRKVMNLGKPSKEFGEFIKQSFSVSKSDRVLIIGNADDDNVEFARNCEFQMLIIGDKGLESRKTDNLKYCHIKDVNTLSSVYQEV